MSENFKQILSVIYILGAIYFMLTGSLGELPENCRTSFSVLSCSIFSPSIFKIILWPITVWF